MKSILNAIRRACLWLLIRDLERELHDRQNSIHLPAPIYEYTTKFIEIEKTRSELVKARSEYNALLPAGSRKTWKVA